MQAQGEGGGIEGFNMDECIQLFYFFGGGSRFGLH